MHKKKTLIKLVSIKWNYNMPRMWLTNN